MAAPQVTFTASGTKISARPGYDAITVKFSADIPYQNFECRATKSGEDFGVGKGALVASFAYTPAETERTFEIYDDYLLRGDGEYRISLFAQGQDGAWNDNHGFYTSEGQPLHTADGKKFLCMR